MSAKTLQGKYAEKLEKENNNMNDKINELYNKLDAQDEIIEQQIEIINKQKKQIDKAIEFLHNNTMIGRCKEHYDLLEILGDKE